MGNQGLSEQEAVRASERVGSAEGRPRTRRSPLHPFTPSPLQLLLAVARKEAIQLRRDPRTLIVIFLQPLVLMVIYGYCITFDLYHIPFAAWDQDRSLASRAVVESFAQGDHSPYFRFDGYVTDPARIEPLLARGEERF